MNRDKSNGFVSEVLLLLQLGEFQGLKLNWPYTSSPYSYLRMNTE